MAYEYRKPQPDTNDGAPSEDMAALSADMKYGAAKGGPLPSGDGGAYGFRDSSPISEPSTAKVPAKDRIR